MANRFLLLFPALILLFCFCNRVPSEIISHESNEDATLEEEVDFESMLSCMADSIMQNMTLEERVGQCFIPAVYANADRYNLNLIKKYLADYHIGGILLLKGNAMSVEEISRLCNPSSRHLITFIAIDAEWGLGMRLKDAPVYPLNGTISRTADDQLMFDYGREVGLDCRRIGVNMVLGPVMDVIENRRNIIGLRSFGNDPERVSELATAYALGLESCGVISVAKHFPGHGSSSGDSHYMLPVVKHGKEELDSIDLKPFMEYINNGLSSIMVGHINVPALDDSGRPAAMSEEIIEGLLRKTLNFKGLIITDALNMKGANGYSGLDALKAGADIIIGPVNIEEEINRVTEAINEGEISISAINGRCKRIIFYKLLIQEYRISDKENELNPKFFYGSSGEIRNKLKGKYRS